MDKNLVESLYMPATVKALESFSINAESIELIAHSENVTFRVSDAGSDTDYVLRLHRPGYNSLGELDSERLWVRALQDAGLNVPDSLATKQGQNFALVEIAGTDEQCYAGMTTWFEGTLLSDYLEGLERTEREHIFRRIGEIAATIHNQSTRWQVPAGFHRRRLDLDGLLGDEPHWGQFWKHPDLTKSEQAGLLRTRQEFCILLEAYGERPDNFSLIHADLHADNIVHNGDDLALIDFDDSAFGWHMYEIASVLIESTSAPEFEGLCAALLEGYNEHRQLAKRDVELLTTFLLIRGMAIIGWYYQRPEHAGSEHFENVKSWVLEKCNSDGP